jgi:Mn-dependent DtxR family transcriptional regulator
MKLSTQEEYGLRCLLQLARAGDAASLTIAEMSEREGISSPNVAKIMRILRRAGLVRSTRGKAGGYYLSRPARTSARSTCWRPSADACSNPGLLRPPCGRRVFPAFKHARLL